MRGAWWTAPSPIILDFRVKSPIFRGIEKRKKERDMPTTTETATGLPARDTIEDKYKWDLTDLYGDEKAWEDEFSAAKDLIARASDFSGKLADSPATMYECLTARSDLDRMCGDLFQYARLSRDLDNRASKFQAMVDRVSALSSEAAAAYSFVEPELLEIEDDRLREMAAQFERTDVYDFYIKELIRSRKHIRSREVEEVLAQSVVVARGADSVFTMLNDADIQYGEIEDEDGKRVALTKQRFAKFMDSSDRRVRRDAHEAFYLPYKEHVNTLSASLSAAVNADIFYARAHRFDTALEAALDRHNIPVSVYHQLLDTTEANLKGLHDYVRLRGRLLKIEDMRPYDMMCPLVPDRDYEVAYDDAVNQIIEALKPLGDEYIKTLTDGFRSRWVDVFETDGKGSGAYSWGNYGSHPFVLMNYNDTVDNMFTLAHEMGHALHSYRSNAAQPYPKAQYSIFVAEVASTLNEGLLAQHLLGKAGDDRDKLYLLNRQIDNAVGTFFNQVLYARFELRTHEEIEKGGALSPDMLNQLWGELTQQYYGPDLKVDPLTPLKWSRIPHFYYTYYVYQYATSFAASQAILEKFNAGEQGIIDKYLNLLAAGGSNYPIELLKVCGVDMSTPDPVEATLRLFEKQIAQADVLTK